MDEASESLDSFPIELAVARDVFGAGALNVSDA